MDYLPNRLVRQFFFLLLLVALAGLLCWNLHFFIPALLGAYTLYVLLRPALHLLMERWHWPRGLAAAVLMLLSALVIFIPVNWIVQSLSQRLSGILSNPQALWQNFESLVHNIERRYGLALWTSDRLKTLMDWSYNQASHLLGATVDGFALLLVCYLILWFMFNQSGKMENAISKWLPLQSADARALLRQFNNLVYSNALGIPLMGLVQGAAGLLAYTLAGVPDPWIWFALTFLAGMMPLFGAMLAYVPLSLILLAGGSPLAATFVFLYGLIVIGSVDNLARMWLLNKIGHAHPLVTFFGVIIGLKLFGFIGFVFGPILISIFLLLLQIYEKEYRSA